MVVSKRTKSLMVAAYEAWARHNEWALEQSGRQPPVLGAASAAGFCLVSAQGRSHEALEIATRQPRVAPWPEAVRYLSEIVADELADTVPASRLTLVQ